MNSQVRPPEVVCQNEISDVKRSFTTVNPTATNAVTSIGNFFSSLLGKKP